ncbi:MAG: hypothetical protein ACUVV3_03290 [Dehalococcoidia bacterium]
MSGIEHWFDELGKQEGYRLDKRLQSWSFEMVAMAGIKTQAHYVHPNGSGRRLDIAAIGSENLPVVGDSGRTEMALERWLRSEVWPKHPSRGVCLYLGGRLWPVWLLNPAVGS